MKEILTFILIIITVTGQCQNSDSIKTRKFSIGFSIIPAYCDEVLSTDSAGFIKQFVDMRNESEMAKMVYSAGLKINYQFNSRAAIELGFLFYDRGVKTKEMDVINPNNSNVTGKATFDYNYNYVDFPLKINYNLTTNRMKLFITAGMSVNKFLNQTASIHIIYNDGRKEIKSVPVSSFGISKLNYSIFAGLGLDYNISNNFHVSVEPVFNRLIKNVYDKDIVNMNLIYYTIGLSISAYCRPF